MKNRIFTLFLVTFTHFSIAQVQQEKSFAMSPAAAESAEAVTARGWRTNISISLPEVKKSMVNRLWADYARNRFGSRVKYDRKTREFVALDANINALSAGRVNLIGQTTQSGRDVRFNLSLEIPEMSASPAAFTSRRAPDATFILKDFAREVEREKVRLRILEEDRNLQKMENELRQLKNANLRYHREIEYAEARILKARENIAQNQKDQVLAAEQIEKQKGLLAQVKRLFQQL